MHAMIGRVLSGGRLAHVLIELQHSIAAQQHDLSDPPMTCDHSDLRLSRMA